MQEYLSRIGYSGDGAHTVENLSRLLRCHLETVPFENLDFWKNPRPMSLKQEDLYHKVVRRRRGGVCFELNGIFSWLLNEMGYDTYPILVRIMMGPPPNPISHQGNIVRLNGKRYYCDVGFGGPGPKGVVCLDDPEIQNVDGCQVRVEWEGIHCTILTNHSGQWRPLMMCIDHPFQTVDFSILLYFFTTNPESHFVRDRVVNLCLPNGSMALTGNHLTIHSGGQVTERDLASEEEATQVLKEKFGLVV